MWSSGGRHGVKSRSVSLDDVLVASTVHARFPPYGSGLQRKEQYQAMIVVSRIFITKKRSRTIASKGHVPARPDDPARDIYIYYFL